MKLWVYIIRRILLLIPVIIGVMTVTFVAVADLTEAGAVTFVIVSALPVNDKLVSYLGPNKLGYNPLIQCAEIGINKAGTCPNPAYTTGYDALGLNQPLYTQWFIYVTHSLTLNWGSTDAKSFASDQFSLGGAVPITQVLGWYLPYTLELAAISLFLILILAIPIGNYSAVYRNRPLDQGARILSFSGFAMPGFLLGILMLFAFTAVSGGTTVTFCNGTATAYSQWYGSWPTMSCFNGGVYPSWLSTHLNSSPTGFPTIDAAINGNWFLALDTLRRMILPAIVIAYGSIAGILRFVRNSMLEVMNLDFIRTARAKGVPESTVVGRHAGRNSVNVTVTVLGLTFAGFIGGFPIIESVFGLRGIGLLLAYSIQSPFDYGLIFGTTLLFTIIVVIANIIVDILYAYLDPRVRLG
ncbi:MAG: ABC transporter permease [Thermoplasmata archaeon]|nr:ABC transporter permease [Thermoplasmata archaeon]